MTRAATGATALGLLGWALAGAPWQLFAAAILTGAGFAATSGAAIIAMVSPWFVQRRAAALSHALNGASAAGILFTPLWVLLIDKTGFVVAAASVGVVMTATIWPLAGRFLGPTPETKGVAPDGEASSQSVRTQLLLREAKPLWALFRDCRFATISAGFALGFFAQIGLVTHLVERLARSWGPREQQRRSARLRSARFLGAFCSGACWGAPTAVWRRREISQCKPAAWPSSP